ATLLSILRIVHTSLTLSYFFFFTHTAPPEIYPLSLHDALPIYMDVFPAMYLPSIRAGVAGVVVRTSGDPMALAAAVRGAVREVRSEEHTSELQSLTNLVCRLLLEKRKCSPNPPIRSGVPPAIPL